jgi:excisionase family DNA binding protein
MTQIDATRRGLPSPQSVELLLLSKKQSASALGVSERTISTLLATKRLPCRKIGRRTLIPVSAVRKFAKAGE